MTEGGDGFPSTLSGLATIQRIELKLDTLLSRVAEVAQVQAVHEHRIMQAEAAALQIRALEKDIERLETTVKIMALLGVIIGVAGILFIAAQLLGLTP